MINKRKNKKCQSEFEEDNIITQKSSDNQLESSKTQIKNEKECNSQQLFEEQTSNLLKNIKSNLIYDITDKKTFENVRNWVRQIKEEVSDKVCIILVANKIDAEEKRVVSTEEGEKMAAEFKLYGSGIIY